MKYNFDSKQFCPLKGHSNYQYENCSYFCAWYNKNENECILFTIANLLKEKNEG